MKKLQKCNWQINMSDFRKAAMYCFRKIRM